MWGSTLSVDCRDQPQRGRAVGWNLHPDLPEAAPAGPGQPTWTRQQGEQQTPLCYCSFWWLADGLRLLFQLSVNIRICPVQEVNALHCSKDFRGQFIDTSLRKISRFMPELFTEVSSLWIFHPVKDFYTLDSSTSESKIMHQQPVWVGLILHNFLSKLWPLA